MGKPTGFMEYEREENETVRPLERIADFQEFHRPLEREARKKQGARCMNCGVPFCQSGMILNGMATGCPLHNLIPEFNDEIYRDNWQEALSRLLKTNDFPEFTSRVCPALCEVACTCGKDGLPVTVKDNEYAIAEYGFRNGLIAPRAVPVRTDKRVAIVGSGPAGLAAANRLNFRGHNVTVFEKEDRCGGLLQYGIPNMKLDKRVVQRRVEIMREEGVRFLTDTPVNTPEKATELLRDYDAVILACGSETPRDLTFPGREGKNVVFAVDFLKATTKKLYAPDSSAWFAKGKRVVVVGGGDTGNDCVGSAIRQGCKSVVQLEMMPKPPSVRTENNPWPEYPRVLKTDYGQEEAIAVFGADPRKFSTTVASGTLDEKGELTEITIVRLDPATRTQIEGSEEKIPCDLLIIAAGFVGARAEVAEAFGLKRTPRGAIESQGYRTENEKIFAAGDARRGQSLVVWAISEGRACAKAVDEYLMGYSML